MAATLKERIEAELRVWHGDLADLLRDCAAEIERLTTQAEANGRDLLKYQALLTNAQAERDEWKARTRPIPGVTDGSREYEAYTLDEVALIEAQRGKSYSRLRVTVRTMLALATNHAMLLGGDTEDYVALPEKSGIAVLEFRAKHKAAEAERDEWKAKARELAMRVAGQTFALGLNLGDADAGDTIEAIVDEQMKVTR